MMPCLPSQWNNQLAAANPLLNAIPQSVIRFPDDQVRAAPAPD